MSYNGDDNDDDDDDDDDDDPCDFILIQIFLKFQILPSNFLNISSYLTNNLHLRIVLNFFLMSKEMNKSKEQLAEPPPRTSRRRSSREFLKIVPLHLTGR